MKKLCEQSKYSFEASQAIIELPDYFRKRLSESDCFDLLIAVMQRGFVYPYRFGDLSRALIAAVNELQDRGDCRTCIEQAAARGTGVRVAAVLTLAEIWPDETTRKLFIECADYNKNDFKIFPIMCQALVDNWPDGNTRNLLAERAVQYSNKYSRCVVLHALVNKWPDETTRKLLADRVVGSELTKDQQAEHFDVLAGMHSEFGHIVFTKDLDGIGPYLDLQYPISRDHIELAAKKANIPTDKIDETVRSLSEHLGWDITKGIV